MPAKICLCAQPIHVAMTVAVSPTRITPASLPLQHQLFVDAQRRVFVANNFRTIDSCRDFARRENIHAHDLQLGGRHRFLDTSGL